MIRRMQLAIATAAILSSTCWVSASDPAAGSSGSGKTTVGRITITSGNATNALDHDEDGACAANQDQSIGWQFDVLESIQVCALQWYDEDGTGLPTSHRVGIFGPTGTLITSTTIPAGTAAPLDGKWRTVELSTAVTLPPGQGYIVGGYNGSDAGQCLHFDVSQTVHPSIRYIDATFSNLNGIFERPDQPSAATNGFYGCSFQIGSGSPCPLERLLEDAPFPLGQTNPAKALNIARRFRDEVLRTTPEGKQLVDLYYRHSSEVTSIMFRNPGLMIESGTAFLEALPAIVQACENGGELVLSPKLFEKSRQLLDRFAAKASPEARVALLKAQAFADAHQDDGQSQSVVLQIAAQSPPAKRHATLFGGAALALTAGLCFVARSRRSAS